VGFILARSGNIPLVISGSSVANGLTEGVDQLVNQKLSVNQELILRKPTPLQTANL
jgi:hypothetical protein